MSLMQALQETKPPSSIPAPAAAPPTATGGSDFNDLAAALGTPKDAKNSVDITLMNPSDDVSALMEALQKGNDTSSSSNPCETDFDNLAAALGTPSNAKNSVDITLTNPSDDVCSLMEALQGGMDNLGGEKENDSLSIKSGGEGGADSEDKSELLVDDSLFKDTEAVRKDEFAAVRTSKMIAKAENLMVVLNMKKFPLGSRSGNDSAMGSEAGNSSSSSSQKMSQRSAGSKKEKKLLKLLKN